MSNSFALCIPTCGRSWPLWQCLSSLAAHRDQLSDFQVILIDNNPAGQQSGEIEQLIGSERYRFITYQRCESPGLTAARHQLLSSCDCDVLCYVDDDVIFSRSWFEAIRNAFSDAALALAGGPTIPRFSGSIPAWLWEFISPTPYGGWHCTWLSLLDLGRDLDGIDPNWIWGLNFAVRREALLACGGFHLDLVPQQYSRWQGDGETGLTRKLAEKGYKAAYRQQALLFHQCGDERLRPESFIRRARYQGICDSYTDLRAHLRHGSAADQTLQQRRPHAEAPAAAAAGDQTSPAAALEPAWSLSAASLRDRCDEAWLEGYLFHQRGASQDEALRHWIARDTYLDVDLRELVTTQPSTH